MVDFSKIKQKEIRSEELEVDIKITLQKCGLDAQELADRLSYLYNNSRDKGFSEFIVSLLRISRASTWDLKLLEVNESASRKESSGQIQTD